MAGALPLCELQSAQPDEHFPSKQGKKFCRLFFQACSDFSLSMTSDFATRSTGVVILTARFPHDCKPPALAGLLTSGCEGKARGTSHSPSPQPPACPGLIQAQLEASAAFPLTSLPKYSLPLFLQEGKERRIKDWIHRRTEGKIHVLGCHKMHGARTQKLGGGCGMPGDHLPHASRPLCPLRPPFALRERASKTGVPPHPSQPSCFISGKHLLGGLSSFSANYREMLEKLMGRLRSHVWGSSRAASRQPAQTRTLGLLLQSCARAGGQRLVPRTA